MLKEGLPSRRCHWGKETAAAPSSSLDHLSSWIKTSHSVHRALCAHILFYFIFFLLASNYIFSLRLESVHRTKERTSYYRLLQSFIVFALLLSWERTLSKLILFTVVIHKRFIIAEHCIRLWWAFLIEWTYVWDMGNGDVQSVYLFTFSLRHTCSGPVISE